MIEPVYAQSGKDDRRGINRAMITAPLGPHLHHTSRLTFCAPLRLRPANYTAARTACQRLVTRNSTFSRPPEQCRRSGSG